MWTIADHATTDLVTAEPTATAQQCAHLFETLGLRHLPVLDADGRPRGVVSDSRILGLMRKDIWDVPIGEMLLEPPVVVPGSTPLLEALVKLMDHKTDAALVVDDEGVLVGIFTEHDALKLAGDVIPPWMEVRYAVSPGMELYAVALGTTADEARQTMWAHQIRHLIAVDDDGDLVGVVSLRDLAGRDLATVDKRLHSPVLTIDATDDLHKAVGLMVEHKVGVLPVLGEDGVKAVLTRTDVVRALIRRMLDNAQDDG